MINGKGDEGLSACAGYYRKSGVPCCGSSYADGSQWTEKLPEQRSTEQGHEFPQDIIDEATVPISALRASVMRILDKE